VADEPVVVFVALMEDFDAHPAALLELDLAGWCSSVLWPS
jgi:hypothetical protein